MHEQVLSSFPNKPPVALRRPSLAGHGWTERMRTTVFAFMGLMAAAGLALVAIFAQLGFPLLEPAPLPSDPSRANAVAEAEVVTVSPKRRGPERDRAARPSVNLSSSDAGAARAAAPVTPADSAEGAPSGAADSPKPAGSTEVAPPAGVGAAPAAPKAPSTPVASTPGGTPVPKPTSNPAPAPAPSPPPVTEAPVPPPAPPAPPPEASTAGGPPPHSSAGGNGNGKALGLSK